jgi:hypothetical protein
MLLKLGETHFNSILNMAIISFSKQELDQYLEELNAYQETLVEYFPIKLNEHILDHVFKATRD